MKYNPDDFTLAAYKNLLTLAQGQYNFCTYTEESPNSNGLYWRHDVDFSLEQAVRLAEIEAKHQIYATYFILLRSSYYNPLDHESVECIKAILQLGHAIGLHFDVSFYDIYSIEDLVYWLSFERKILSQLFNTTIPVFSFHNPSPETLFYDERNYAGMVNTYSSYFKHKVDYCSDSNGYWRYQSIEQALKNDSNRPLQVLTHPVWWTTESLSPREKIESYLIKKKDYSMKRYDKVLENHSRVNLTATP